MAQKSACRVEPAVAACSPLQRLRHPVSVIGVHPLEKFRQTLPCLHSRQTEHPGCGGGPDNFSMNHSDWISEIFPNCHRSGVQRMLHVRVPCFLIVH